MWYLIKCFLIPLCVTVSAGIDFRFDYEYYPNIDGWLKLHLIPATWRDAFKTCDLEGTVLASPSNTRMISAMIFNMNQKNKDKWGIFTGVHATFSKRNFFSIEGTSLARMPVKWAKDEPNNADYNEDCILFFDDGTIADVDCSNSYPFMCYKKKTEDVVLTSCGTIDKAYELDTGTRNCYKFHGVGKTWEQAYMTCAAEGGYLAIINSKKEAEFMKQFYEKNSKKIDRHTNKDVLMLGFHDWGEHGVWRTVHGLKLAAAGYDEWANDRPDNATGGQFCGAMSHDAKLDDWWCDHTAPFACEKSPYSLLNDFMR